MNEEQAQYHIQEMVTLKSEIQALSSEVYSIMNLSMVGTVAVYSWLLTNDKLQVGYLEWMLPIMLSLWGVFRTIGCFLRIGTIGDYIRKLEDVCSAKKDGVDGWHHYLDQMPAYRAFSPHFIRTHFIGFTLALFWFGQIAIQTYAVIQFGGGSVTEDRSEAPPTSQPSPHPAMPRE